VNRHYEKGSLLISSNQPVGAWGEMIEDTILATAILDRLLHRSHVITIKDGIFRWRENAELGSSRPRCQRLRKPSFHQLHRSHRRRT
jgi:DNA replication protein DnaC